LLFALGLAAGCGKTGTSESGETHFVSCNVDADCTDVAGAHTCAGGFCRGPANDGSSGSAKTPACDGGCGDAECAAPGTCTLAAACQVVDCGTALVDDNACVRPSCENDDGCPDDERCAALWLGKHYQCVQSGSSCDCTAGLGLFPVNICSPVALAGVRGRWERLVVTEEVLGDTTTRTFWPDGRVDSEQRSAGTAATVPSTGQLSPEDLDELTRQINGTDLRLQLAVPEECPLNKGRADMVDLYLVDGNGNGAELPNLSKDVAGCLNVSAQTTAFVSLIDLVSRY
jgi:hypothetical protein